jgi:hypothetical protein
MTSSKGVHRGNQRIVCDLDDVALTIHGASSPWERNGT